MIVSKEEMEADLRAQEFKKALAKEEERKKWLAKKHSAKHTPHVGKPSKVSEAKHTELVNKNFASFKKWEEGQAYEKEKAELDDAFANANASMAEAAQIVNKCYTDGLVYKKR